ncbi:MAG: hypothetical protein IPN93_15815 [Bacteroidetes bacterium]|nr:hypothetical protein [Bacteroidota bacterium]MBK7505877.1 hypothetical protein [Bacteroidota bacterium]MBK8674386.1 hypothetical protein [Bacteroidota bacterium]MBK9355433.1 hypothetical protein [Bacteroidota bacterium]MBK9634567.1 hypothetical protein [Bacteroidota bacterium]
MKKIKIMFLSLGMVALLSTGACKKDSDSKCDDALDKVASTFAAFDASSTAANCAAYKSAINEVLSNCDLTDAEKATYNGILAVLPECVD